MFTGIVHHLGRIIALQQMPNARRFIIECQFPRIIEGESIAVNGVCLTAVNPIENHFECDVSPETLQLTNLNSLEINTLVNLERSLTLQEPLGGHFVYGHVDKTLGLKEKLIHHDFLELIFGDLSPEDLLLLPKKGSVAINGVSLTLNEVYPRSFSVLLIPHTQVRTNLNLLEIGQQVNIEFDFITRAVANVVQRISENS